MIRYGGDEFICAVAGLTLADATERFALVNASLADGAHPGAVTVGLTELQGGDSSDDVVARADALLYGKRETRRRPRA
jgi:GGDEF domain-containing protein